MDVKRYTIDTQENKPVRFYTQIKKCSPTYDYAINFPTIFPARVHIGVPAIHHQKKRAHFGKLKKTDETKRPNNVQI